MAHIRRNFTQPSNNCFVSFSSLVYCSQERLSVPMGSLCTSGFREIGVSIPFPFFALASNDICSIRGLLPSIACVMAYMWWSHAHIHTSRILDSLCFCWRGCFDPSQCTILSNPGNESAQCISRSKIAQGRQLDYTNRKPCRQREPAHSINPLQGITRE
jgi:hypothetical protein